MILLMLFATCGVMNLQGDFMTEDNSWYYDTLLIRDENSNSFTYISEDKYFDLTENIESYEIIDNAFNDTLYFWTDNHHHTELPDRTMYYDSETNEYLDVVPEDIIIVLEEDTLRFREESGSHAFGYDPILDLGEITYTPLVEDHGIVGIWIGPTGEAFMYEGYDGLVKLQQRASNKAKRNGILFNPVVIFLLIFLAAIILVLSISLVTLEKLK